MTKYAVAKLYRTTLGGEQSPLKVEYLCQLHGSRKVLLSGGLFRRRNLVTNSLCLVRILTAVLSFIGMEGTFIKHSQVLGRDAVWLKKQKIASLPKYLCFQFMRFFWKATPDNRDHLGVKCKIMRAVTYPEVRYLYMHQLSCVMYLQGFLVIIACKGWQNLIRKL